MCACLGSKKVVSCYWRKSLKFSSAEVLKSQNYSLLSNLWEDSQLISIIKIHKDILQKGKEEHKVLTSVATYVHLSTKRCLKIEGIFLNAEHFLY